MTTLNTMQYGSTHGKDCQQEVILSKLNVRIHSCAIIIHISIQDMVCTYLCTT